MVPKHGDLIEIALDKALAPARDVRERRRLERMPRPVALDVRLGDDEDALFVAEIVPMRIVRIMRRAHRVDVELLQELDIPLHLRARHRITAFGRHLVTVDAVNDDASAVELEDAVLDRHRPEAEALLVDVARALDANAIKRRLFGAPELHVRHRQLVAGETASEFVSPEIKKLPRDRRPPFRRDADDTRLAFNPRLHIEIDESRRRLADQLDRAEESAHPPKVLIFEIRTVAVLEDLEFEVEG